MREVGIVVIGRNEGERLCRCLRSIPFPSSTVVYVDSGSSDGSPELAIQFGAVLTRLNASTAFTAGRARNAGVSALLAEKPELPYVQFIDGDCELAPDWIGQGLDFFERNSDVAAVCGRRRERHPESSVYNRLCDLEWDTPVGEAAAVGGDALFRIEAFRAVGGFNPALIAGEEPELCRRLRDKGWKVWRLDAEMTMHDAAMTRFRQWWARGIRGGYGHTQTALVRGRYLTRPILSALVWTIVLPLIIAFCGLFIHPLFWFSLGIYPAQMLRISHNRGDAFWAYGLYIMLLKPAMLQGALRFWLTYLRKGAVHNVEYKNL